MNTKSFSLIVLATISAGLLWRSSGEAFTFGLPTSVSVVEGKVQAPREIKFLRHWQVFGWYSPREIDPSLQVDTIIQVDLSSPEITEWAWSTDGKGFRVSQVVGEEVTQTYFLKTDKVLRGAKSITLRIKNNGSTPSDAIHQQGWFWVREFYDCEVLAVS